MSMYELTLIEGVEGGVYIGKLKNGKPHGKGILKYHDGSKYVGEFEDGKCNGQGILNSQNSTYEGEWMDNHIHGRGRLIFGDDVQDGFWHMGNYECDIGDELEPCNYVEIKK